MAMKIELNDIAGEAIETYAEMIGLSVEETLGKVFRGGLVHDFQDRFGSADIPMPGSVFAAIFGGLEAVLGGDIDITPGPLSL